MVKSFFASCNSYSGFKSYFAEIFNSNEFDKVFVLKGGPGTGKSTLMKKTAKYFEGLNADIEKFYCSSDINSLDGVIIEKNHKKVAILDGTAPHERDAVIVGAIDEIINLGESLDYSWLEKYRQSISELSDQKSAAYGTAYSYLRCAGACEKEICRNIKKQFNVSTAQKYMRDLELTPEYYNISKNKTRLISSFSKDGYQRVLPVPSYESKQVKLGGNVYGAREFLSFLTSRYDGNCVIFPYPLNINYNEAIYYPKEDTLIIVDDNASDINADVFLSDSSIENEKIRVIEQTHNELLTEAKRWFNIASDIHFRLEDIYSRCMNFEINDKIFDKICEKIAKVCDIEK